MITLGRDCLVFQMNDGQNIPFSADMISVELMGESAQQLDPEFVRNVAQAVFHYFRNDQGRQTVTAAEFAQAVEMVLRGFNLPGQAAAAQAPVRAGVVDLDLYQLAKDTGSGCELFFFPLLRQELRQQIQQQTRLLWFHGLRACVKELTGTRRWTGRCQTLREQIVDYLRECLGNECSAREFSMMVQ